MGLVEEDQILTIDTSGISDIDGLGAFSYQWYREGVAIAGATASTHTLADADVGANITVTVSYTDQQGTPESTTSAAVGPVANVNDLPTGSVTIDNMTPAQGDVLTASNNLSDADGLSGPISYQWYRDGVAIGGATGATYTTTQTDVGSTVSVVASYTDDHGTNESVSSVSTSIVSNVNDPVAGQPVIVGTPEEDQTLSADTTGISDVDGLSAFSYQWYRDGLAIGGATASTYTLGDADVDTSITVTVNYTDQQGASEATTSAAVGPVANVNDVPSGSVTIDNMTPAQGDVLTASNTLSDADGLAGSITYQWYRDGVAITGATGTTYTTTQTDVGSVIAVVASYTDDRGSAESVSSAATAAVTNVNDPVSGQPVITGLAEEDQTLTVDTSGVSDADGLGAFSYQWYRDGVAIAAATASTYSLGDADVGASITVAVSYTDQLGNAESTTSAAVGPVANVNDAPAGLVLIDDMTPAQGDLLTASNTLTDADGLNGPIEYQWYRDGVAITGATGSAYTTTQTDVGSVISVVASYTDDQGTAESMSSAGTAVVTNVNDPVAGQPVIVGSPEEDQTLTTDTAGISDADGLGVFSYQWYRDGLAIGGATSSTYTLGDADVDASITVTVSYTDQHGNAESTTSAAVGPVTNINDAPEGSVLIDNTTPAQGEVLTASNSLSDADGLSEPISYQWYRDGVAITGATGTTYTTTQTDVGSVISVVASYTDDQGTAESVSSVGTAAVTNVNDPVSGQPVITGLAAEDQTLSVDTSGISDADGLDVFSYQWYRDGVAIAGASTPTYTLGDADVGANVSVSVSYTDQQGTSESATSAAVGPVANVNDAPSGSVLIDNMTPSQGDVLTASNSLSDADGISGPIGYQWYRDGLAIGGATGATYTATQTDVGSTVSVVVSYTDDHGTNESVSSVSTAVVTNVNDPVAGQPVIVGTSEEDQTLTADTTGISDTDGVGAFSYQWYRNGVSVAGATSATYTLGDSDVGADMVVVVSYTDQLGTPESAMSAPVGPVANVNDLPETQRDAFTTNEDTPLRFAVGALLANDADADGDTLTLASTSQPRHGLLMDNLDGTFTYQPDADFHGIDSFTYVASDDQGGLALQVVEITVEPVNDAPQLTSEAVMSVSENSHLLPALTGLDAEGDSIAFAISGGADAERFAVDAATGSLSLRAPGDFEAPADADADNVYQLEVTLSDANGASSTHALTLSVLDANEAPALSDAEVTAEMSQEALVVGQLTSVDPDAGDTQSFSIVAGNDAGAFTIDPETGELTAAESVGVGTHILSVQVSDAGGLTATAKVSVTITDPDAGPTQVLVVDDADPLIRGPESDVHGNLGADPTSGEDAADPAAADSAAEASAEESSSEESSEEDRQAVSGVDAGVVSNLSGLQRLSLDQVAQDMRPGAPTGQGESRLQYIIKLLFSDQEASAQGSLLPADAIDLSNLSISIPVSPELADALDQWGQDMMLSGQDLDLRVAGTVVGTVTLSAGFVVWMLRAGSLMASLLATRPLWSEFDPLPVFNIATGKVDLDHIL